MRWGVVSGWGRRMVFLGNLVCNSHKLIVIASRPGRTPLGRLTATSSRLGSAKEVEKSWDPAHGNQCLRMGMWRAKNPTAIVATCPAPRSDGWDCLSVSEPLAGGEWGRGTARMAADLTLTVTHGFQHTQHIWDIHPWDQYLFNLWGLHKLVRWTTTQGQMPANTQGGVNCWVLTR